MNLCQKYLNYQHFVLYVRIFFGKLINEEEKEDLSIWLISKGGSLFKVINVNDVIVLYIKVVIVDMHVRVKEKNILM
jgi:hypothetical protein